MTKPLHLIIRWTVILTIIIITAYLIFVYHSSINTEKPLIDKEAARRTADEIKLFGTAVFNFLKPLLQLALLLLIVEWILNRLGLTYKEKLSSFRWDVQTVIGIIVISGFTLAALSGGLRTNDLKDIALVIVGFYFGTQRNTLEFKDNRSKERQSTDVNHELKEGEGRDDDI